jgi:hypothetical protein
VQKYPHALCISGVTSSHVTPVVAGGRDFGWHFAPGNGNKTESLRQSQTQRSPQFVSPGRQLSGTIGSREKADEA